MREQFNLENFLAGKYERVENGIEIEVLDLTYLPSGTSYNLAGVVQGDREMELLYWTKEGYYHYNNPDSIDLFGILKTEQ